MSAWTPVHGLRPGPTYEELEHDAGGGQQAGGQPAPTLYGLSLQVRLDNHQFLTCFLLIFGLFTFPLLRITKPPVAQLTRIHVVTPKAPVFITLEPRVQPSQGGPVFVTGWEAPHRLTTNSYWVLRLPSVYWGEGGAHLPPPVPPQHGGGVLLSGALGYTEDYTDG